MIEDTISLRAAFYVLKRQVKLILSVVILALTVALVVTLAMTPKFTATTLIQYNPSTIDLLNESDTSQNFSVNNVRIQGELEILRSDAVISQVIETGGVLIDGPVFEDDENLTSAIRNFQKTSSATRRGQTYLIAVEVSATDPNRAANLANIWAESYISHQINVKVEGIRAVESIIQTRLEQARLDLLQSDTDINNFILENLQTIQLHSGDTSLAQLGGSISELQLRIDAGQSRIFDIQNAALPKQLRDTISAATIEQRLQQLNQQLTAESQSIVDVKQTEIIQLQIALRQFQSQLQERVLNSDLPAEILTQIYALQQESGIIRGQYDRFLERRQTLRLQADLQVADSRVVSAALPPLHPSSRSKISILAGALAVAIFTGIGAAFVREYWVGGFTSTDQFSAVFSVPVATSIPEITKGKSTSITANKFLEFPMSEYAESIRRLRFSLDQSLNKPAVDTDKGKVVMVTSSVQGEGKSNTCIALGRAYALSDKRVILIDCDLRKPKLHDLLAGSSAQTLQDILTRPQPTNLTDIVLHKDHTGLEALIGKASDFAITDQIFSAKPFLDLIKQATKEYDLVILDTAPMLPIVDSTHLAKIADVIALTVKWASTSQIDVRHVLRLLASAKNPKTDIVAVLSQEKSVNRTLDKNTYSYYTT